jgi:CxxC-x17-CxxC domain-containing protein
MAYDQNNQGGGFQRKMYQGNWKCAKCNTDITELPFEPDPDKSDRLMCRDCYREKRQSFGGGRPNFRR